MLRSIDVSRRLGKFAAIVAKYGIIPEDRDAMIDAILDADRLSQERGHPIDVRYSAARHRS